MNALPHSTSGALPAGDARALQSALSARFGGARVTLDGPLSVRDYSLIYRARIDSDVPFAAALKQCIDPRRGTPAPDEAQRQFAALVRVSKALSSCSQADPRYRVPRPLEPLPEFAAYAMTWVDGIALTHRMRGLAAPFNAAGWLEATGAWLRNFHRAGPWRRERASLAQPIDVIGQLESSPLTAQPAFALALRTLRQAIPRLEGIDVDVSWLHGDCKADNFIIADDGICGIDISLAHQNAVEYDLGQFLNHLELLLAGPRFIHLRGQRARLEDALRRGYRDAGTAVCDAYLDWLRLVFAVTYWHNETEGRDAGLRLRALNWLFRALTNRLSARVGHLR